MICAYPTVKYVSIQDTRLVVLRYVLLLIIVSYVGIFEMWWMGGWLEQAPLVGVVRFSLQQPTVGNCDPVLPNCDNDFSPVQELEYCEQSNHDDTATIRSNAAYPGNRYPCEIYEAINAQVISEKSLTVITRASTIRQQFVCPSSINDNNDHATNMTCQKTYQNTSDEYKFYTAESERFTVLLDHAVTASKICARHQGLAAKGKDKALPYACSAEASNPAYRGRLFSKNDELCQQEHVIHNAFQGYRGSTETAGAPCYISPNRTKSSHQDFFSLGVLLQAAGVSLDDCNNHKERSSRDDIINGNDNVASCQTYRDSGATLLLNIYWSDFVPYHGLVEPHYYYAPELLGRSSFKQYVPFYDNNYRESRTLLNAHGIRVAVLLGGEFNQFNIVTFLVTLTTALGLLAVATTIVDSLMIYVMPERERYQEAKYENTEAFEANDVVTSTVAGLTQLLTVHTAQNDAGSIEEATSTHNVGAGNGEGSLTDPLLGAETWVLF